MMITGYDHYVNIPLATRLGGFGKPEKMLIYSTRTDGYNGEPVEGVPEENWLPLKRGDYGIDVSLCIYLPDLEKFKTWTQPKAERLSS